MRALEIHGAPQVWGPTCLDHLLGAISLTGEWGAGLAHEWTRAEPEVTWVEKHGHPVAWISSLSLIPLQFLSNVPLTSLFHIIIIQSVYRKETSLKHMEKDEILASVPEKQVSFPNCLKRIIFLKWKFWNKGKLHQPCCHVTMTERNNNSLGVDFTFCFTVPQTHLPEKYSDRNFL